MERRSVEIRAEIAGNTLTGHAAVFNQETRIGDWYEHVEPTFFDRPLRERQDTVLQAEHAGLPLARTTSGTLKLSKDSTGLVFEADVAPTTTGADVRALVERGDLVACSFGFSVAEDAWSVRKDGAQSRALVECERLWDISVVTFPAYAGTDVALRAELVVPPKLYVPLTAADQARRLRLDMHKSSNRRNVR
jgi:HK97 family phage prohead protease